MYRTVSDLRSAIVRRGLVTLVALLGFASIASAQTRPRYHIGLLLGPSVVVENEEYEDDLTFGIGIGADWNGPGLEFTYLYTQLEGEKPTLDVQNVSLKLSSFGLAGTWGLSLGPVRPYVLAGGELYITGGSVDAAAVGGGGAAVRVSIDSVDVSLQLGTGIDFRIGPVTLGPELRYRRMLTNNYGDTEVLEGTGLEKRFGLLSLMGRVNYAY